MALKEKLQEKLGDDYLVEFASNYQRPNIKEITGKLLKQNVSRIIAFPLFPQYSSSTTGSLTEKLLKILAGQYNIPAIKTIPPYFNHPSYLKAMAEVVSVYDHLNYNHILISFHGLPLNQVYKSHNGKSCEKYYCTRELTGQNLFCYQAACYATSRLLAEKLNIGNNNYTVCFQSRFGEKWLQPFTSDVIIELAKKGEKRVLVICPSFTSDCLETTIEIGQDYRDLFLDNGGETLTLVESLNDSNSWVDAISEIIFVP